jgi:hypothetical protein
MKLMLLSTFQAEVERCRVCAEQRIAGSTEGSAWDGTFYRAVSFELL